MTVLNQAYASNTSTPVLTLEFEHSSLSGGFYRIVQDQVDFDGKIEDDSTVSYTATSVGISEPSRGSDGISQLGIQVDNVSGDVTALVKTIQQSNRVGTPEPVIVRMRGYIRGSTEIARAAIVMVVTGVTITAQTAQIRASFQPVYDSAFPRLRYYPTLFKGLKYG